MRLRLRRKKKPRPAEDPLQLLAGRFPDVPENVLQTVHGVSKYTMTSPERLLALCDAIQYIVDQDLPGDIVECGVWRGGSMMAAASTLLQAGDASRRLWLFDTFDGMSEPDAADIDLAGNPATRLLSEQDKQDAMSIWCRSPLDEVKSNLASTGYPDGQMEFVAGKVEETIPGKIPETISCLRLDTDWYESTMHELVHLYPRLVPGGVLIIDDYGHWQGCRRAVDEYIEKNSLSLFLNRIDYTGRIAIKPAGTNLNCSTLRRAG